MSSLLRCGPKKADLELNVHLKSLLHAPKIEEEKNIWHLYSKCSEDEPY